MGTSQNATTAQHRALDYGKQLMRAIDGCRRATDDLNRTEDALTKASRRRYAAPVARNRALARTNLALDKALSRVENAEWDYLQLLHGLRDISLEDDGLQQVVLTSEERGLVTIVQALHAEAVKCKKLQDEMSRLTEEIQAIWKKMWERQQLLREWDKGGDLLLTAFDLIADRIAEDAAD